MSKISINMSKGILRPATESTEPINPDASTNNAAITAEATQLLDATEQFIIRHFSLLTPQEIATTYKQIQQLRDAVAAKNDSQIEAATTALEKLTLPIVERVSKTPNP